VPERRTPRQGRHGLGSRDKIDTPGDKRLKAHCFPADGALGWLCSRDSPFPTSSLTFLSTLGAFHAVGKVVIQLAPPHMVFYSLTLAPLHGYSSCNLCLAPVRARATLQEEAVGGTRLVIESGSSVPCSDSWANWHPRLAIPSPTTTEVVFSVASTRSWSFPEASPAVHLLDRDRIRRFA